MNREELPFMVDTVNSSQLFELELPLPDQRLSGQSRRLVGFEDRYDRMQRHLRLLIDIDGLAAWSERCYGRTLPMVEIVADRYPLVIYHGDVGTGKTATAEGAANRLANDLGRDGMLFKLSTRVRGTGHVGQMSALINQAFDVVAQEAGKRRLAFFVLDEADSLAAGRDSDQSHHEDKVAVNTLIQKIDDVRRFSGRVLVILCTNRFDALDPAIVRRAGLIERFDRPNAQEREALLRLDCEGLALPDSVIEELVVVTGPDGDRQPLGFTFSDLRTRLLPEALSRAYPDRPVEAADILAAARSIRPSPSMGATV
jgi:AAA+ superfamily predicted ATPase